MTNNTKRITGNKVGEMLCEVLGLDTSHVMEVQLKAEWGTVASYTVTYAMTQQQAEDIVGIIETIENKKPEQCQCLTCLGLGHHWGEQCPNCGGTGYVKES